MVRRDCAPVRTGISLDASKERSMSRLKRLGICLLSSIALLACADWPQASGQQKDANQISIGGEPIVVLQRPRTADESMPQFLEATVLPGRGMALLQVKAYLPGKGEIDVLNAP